ncbi:Macrophage mannose receptor 1 [Channa argus]|uniref:Macrophage mannose receptor 1 n=1 Tax=Channa argus TaxID=215402 RepID=A0A6G1Q837_CHAAH|nr:Macrophage mannose receptor 1 [Channa argus]
MPEDHQLKMAVRIDISSLHIIGGHIICGCDSPFQLMNKATRFCLVKQHDFCFDTQWTTGDRLMVTWKAKCLGSQGKTVGSEISLHDCDENSDLQKWECRNETLLALKGQELYIQLTADNTAILSKTIGPNNHLTISGTSSGACTRTYRAKETWTKNTATGASYQLNTQSALTWFQAETSCKQQSASLLSITDPHQQAYITGYSCAMVNGAVQYSWQSSQCNKKLGYICVSKESVAAPTEAAETGFCSSPWIPYNGHCFHLVRNKKTWSDAQQACRKDGGDLVSIRNVEDQSFVISQLGYDSSDELWIGLNDKKTERLFDWSDQSTVTFTSWELGKPTHLDDKQDCVLMMGDKGNWADRVCDEKHGFICMKRSASEPTGDEVDQNIGCKTTFTERERTWYEARDYCKTIGGDLLSLHSHADLPGLTSRYTRVWIGLYAPDRSTGYVWSDTSPVNFQHWEDGEPNNKNDAESCAEFLPYSWHYSGSWNDVHCEKKNGWICQIRAGVTPKPPPDPVTPGFWHDYNCGYERRSICKRKGSTPANTTVAPTVPPKGGCPPEWKKFNFKNKCALINTNPLLGIGKWMPKPCNDTNGFICLQNADSPETTISANYVKILNDSIKVVTQQLNWDTANKYCKDDGANLASLRNEWIQAYVELMAKNLKAPLWIGLNKNQTGGYFKYVDGWHMGFTQWGDNEPKTGQPCVYVDVNGKWKTTSCNQTINSVCLKSADLPPTESNVFPGVCPEKTDGFNAEWLYWQPFKGYCYMLFTEVKSWADAAVSCNTHGEWMWLDKTIMDYINWGEGQPDDRGFGSVVTADGTWKTSTESYRKPYICKTPKVLQITPSPTQRVKVVTSRDHIVVGVVFGIIGIAMGSVIAFFHFKKSGTRLPIPDKLTNFANPLFFSNGQSQCDVNDTSTLVANAEEENPELITI